LNALMKIRSILFLDIVFFVNILKFANCYVHIWFVHVGLQVRSHYSKKHYNLR
jgi:hypothetical protein